MAWAFENMPETMAALAQYAPSGSSRAEVLEHVSADIGLDVTHVTMVADIAQATNRTQRDVRQKLEEGYRDSVRKAAPHSDREVFERSISAMAKYRKKAV